MAGAYPACSHVAFACTLLLLRLRCYGRISMRIHSHRWRFGARDFTIQCSGYPSQIATHESTRFVGNRMRFGLMDWRIT